MTRALPSPLRAALALLACAPAGCVAPDPPRGGAIAPTPIFAPTRFFAGATEGEGLLTVLAHRRRAIHVRGTGQLQADGTLLLSQWVEEDGSAPRQRRWRIREVSPGHYAGTLSDAAGPVAGTAEGNSLRLRFALPGGLVAEQRLLLQPDGRTARNRMTVRKLGIVVAILDETIRKAD